MVGLIGIILLSIGIVKKNAIMMIDFALEAERVENKPPEEAIFQACLLRFRPIMMTTMAALLGGSGAAEKRWEVELGPSCDIRWALPSCWAACWSASCLRYTPRRWFISGSTVWRNVSLISMSGNTIDEPSEASGDLSHEYFGPLYKTSHRNVIAGGGPTHGGYAGI